MDVTNDRRRAGGKTFPLAAALLLLAGTVGFVGFGVLYLVRELETTADVARGEAMRSAVASARELRRWLSSPECLAALPVECRFRIRGSRVEIPPEVGWLTRERAAAMESGLPREAFDRLRAARRAELASGDLREAALLLEEARAVEGLSPLQEAWLLLGAAQGARRSGEVERCRALCDELLAAVDWQRIDAADARWDGIVGGALLLAVELERPPADEIARALDEAFVRIDPALAAAVFERAAGRGTEGSAARLAGLRDRVAAVERRRALLRAVAELLPGLCAWRGGRPREIAGDLVFYQASGEFDGEGALAARSVALAALERARVPGGPLAELGRGERLVAVRGSDEEREAVEIVSGLAAIAAVEGDGAAGPGWTGGWSAVSLIGLAAFLLCGSLLSLRAVRREQLAARTRAEFLTAVTHELKTPLASIRLLAEVLGEGRLPEAQRPRYVERLAGEAARLSMLVENVLDLGRLERGERGYDVQEVDLRDVLTESVRLYRPVAERDGIDLRCVFDEAPCPVRADRTALGQVLLNLFENARRYAAAGKRVDVSCRPLGRSVVVRVRDYGPGIAPEERARVFERFARGAAAVRAGNPGVGLGLYLAREIVRRHRGELRCEEPLEGGAGTVFVIVLPGAALAERTAHAAVAGEFP